MATLATRLTPVTVRPGDGSRPLQQPDAAPPTDAQRLDEALTLLQSRKQAWATTGIDERIALLSDIRRRMAALGERWVAAILDAKGAGDDAFAVGEEWANFALVLRYLRLLERSLMDIKRYGCPQMPGTLKTSSSGQIVARVFPQTLSDRMLFMGVSGDVRMQPGLTREEVLARQAQIYQNRGHPGRQASAAVILVLGAGNAAFMLTDDVMYQLFVADRVVLLKLNPVNAYLEPLLREAMQPLVQAGFLRLATGSAAEGAYLCTHPAVEAIHLTGCDKTFETIVFGPGAEGQRRKAERQPLSEKQISAELGNVTPIIIVPGPWKPRDVREQAVHLATWLVFNAGCNCISERVIVQHETWPQREALLEEMGKVLARIPTHRAYYPGAFDRYDAFLSGRADVRRFGAPQPGHLPWTLIAGVDPANRDDTCFTTEAFCSLVAETGLPASDPADFLDQAVSFANSTLWGTLGATLIVHPASLADGRLAAALERAIAGLNFGTITVNHWLGYAYYLGLSPWGGAPGSDLFDVQSGVGMTKNALMLEGAQKTVYRAPFHKLIDPYTVRSQRVAAFGRKLAAFDDTASLPAFASLLWTALRC